MEYYFDDKRNLNIYKTDATTGLDGEKRVGEFLAIPNTLKNTQRLAALDYPIRPPMMDYHFPGDYKTIPQQRDMANFKVVYPRCFDLSDMRTGKTVSTLWAADFVMREYERMGRKAGVLVLAKKSTVVDTWYNAVTRTFQGARKAAALTGSGVEKYNGFRTEADFYITNYDGFKAVVPGILPDRIQIVVIDEFTAYKHATTARYKHVEARVEAVPYLWLLSGTPTPERSVDAYGPARLVHGLRRESYDSFKRRCMFQVRGFKWEEREEAKEIAAAALSPSIRFTKEQVVGLPNRLPISYRLAGLSSEQRQVLDALKAKTLLEYATKPITPVNASAIRWKFIQGYSGVLYDDDKAVHNLHPTERLGVLKEIVEECEGRVIIFAGLTGVIKLLNSELAGYGPRVIDGQTSMKQRTHIIHELRKNPHHPLIGHPAAIGHGLDLTMYDTIAWYAPVDSAEQYTQANERIEGLNQHNPTQVIHIWGGRFERAIYDRLHEKKQMQDDILELIK